VRLLASSFSVVSPARACLQVRPSTGFSPDVFSSTSKRRRLYTIAFEEVSEQTTPPTKSSATFWPLLDVG
jgi:hypothetical protein